MPLVTTFDSAGYHRYARILFGEDPWETWDFFRGITVPLFTGLSQRLFGYSSQGLVLALFIVGVLTLKSFAMLSKKITMPAVTALTICYFCIDPIIQGYFHVLLPEPLTVPLLLLLSSMWLNPNPDRFTLIATPFLLVLLYQIKEPQILVGVGFLGLILLKHLAERDKRKTAQILCMFGAFFMLNKIVNKTLIYKVGHGSLFGNVHILNNGIGFAGLSGNMFGDTVVRDYNLLQKVESTKPLSGSIRRCSIESGNTVFYFLSNGEIIQCLAPTTLLEAIRLRGFFTYSYPLATIKSFVLNFLEIIRVLPNRFDEIKTVGNFAFNASDTNSNVSSIPKDYIFHDAFTSYVKPYRVDSSNPVGYMAKIDSYLWPLAQFVYPLSFVLMLIWIVLVSIQKDRKSNLFFLALSNLLYLAFNAFLGLVDDRYGFICYPLALIFAVDCVSKQIPALYGRSWPSRYKSSASPEHLLKH